VLYYCRQWWPNPGRLEKKNWIKALANLIVKGNGECIRINSAPKFNPADRDNKLAITESSHFVYIVVCNSSVVHGAQNVEVHGFAPLCGMPYFPNNPVFWDFWVHMD
jgi:hypothetical protein